MDNRTSRSSAEGSRSSLDLFLGAKTIYASQLEWCRRRSCATCAEKSSRSEKSFAHGKNRVRRRDFPWASRLFCIVSKYWVFMAGSTQCNNYFENFVELSLGLAFTSTANAIMQKSTCGTIILKSQSREWKLELAYTGILAKAVGNTVNIILSGRKDKDAV